MLFVYLERSDRQNQKFGIAHYTKIFDLWKRGLPTAKVKGIRLSPIRADRTKKTREKMISCASATYNFPKIKFAKFAKT
jgi:hypothetical protein